jgi:hypothetical protein
MRVTIEFALPEERPALDNALHGDALRAVIDELLEHVRRRLKGEVTEAEAALLEEVRTFVFDACSDAQVPLF